VFRRPARSCGRVDDLLPWSRIGCRHASLLRPVELPARRFASRWPAQVAKVLDPRRPRQDAKMGTPEGQPPGCRHAGCHRVWILERLARILKRAREFDRHPKLPERRNERHRVDRGETAGGDIIDPTGPPVSRCFYWLSKPAMASSLSTATHERGSFSVCQTNHRRVTLLTDPSPPRRPIKSRPAPSQRDSVSRVFLGGCLLRKEGGGDT